MKVSKGQSQPEMVAQFPTWFWVHHFFAPGFDYDSLEFVEACERKDGLPVYLVAYGHCKSAFLIDLTKSSPRVAVFVSSSARLHAEKLPPPGAMRVEMGAMRKLLDMEMITRLVQHPEKLDMNELLGLSRGFFGLQAVVGFVSFAYGAFYRTLGCSG